MNIHFMPFEQVWAGIAGSSRFTLDELIQQMADQFRMKEDFLITHNNKAYGVKFSDIEIYFTTHPVPEKPLTQSEELADLKRRLVDAERELSTLRGIQNQKKAVEEAPVAHEVIPEGGISLEDMQKNLSAKLAARKNTPINKNV